MRQQMPHHGDFVFADMALFGGALDGNDGKFVVGLQNRAGQRVAQVEARQKFRVERIVPHRRFVEEFVVSGDPAGRPVETSADTRVEGEVSIGIFDLMRRRQAEEMISPVRTLFFVDHLERRADASDRLRHQFERARPQRGIEPGGVDRLHRGKHILVHRCCAPSAKNPKPRPSRPA